MHTMCRHRVACRRASHSIVRSQKIELGAPFVFFGRKMNFLVRSFKSFTKFEIALLSGSTVAILVAFFVAKSRDYLSLGASLLGAVMLIFLAKGNVIGQVLTLVFAAIYAYISYGQSYYGEMITYLGMTAPIAVASIISWLRHPFGGDRSEVKVNTLGGKEYLLLGGLTVAVTTAFYYILRELGTANLIPSTVSVLTSFVASYLSMRRSEYYALAYAANDIVLVVLWVLATIQNIGYISVTVCFCVFLVNDLYGFVNWSRVKRNQRNATENKTANVASDNTVSEPAPDSPDEA